MNSRDWQITNAVLVSPGSDPAPGGLMLSRGRIGRLMEGDDGEPDLLNLNLHGLFVYPGLINAHDSLIASFRPFLGDNRPYANWLAWDNDLKSSELFKERMLLELEQLYRLGAYKNVLGGATTVVDHIPHHVRKAAPAELPVKLLEDFGLSHSICSYSLGWGEGPDAEYARASKVGLPYITHIAEGFDRESRESLSALDKEGALGEYTVLTHGLSLSDSDLDRIAEAGASLVWCPTANRNLYEQIGPIGAALERGINVCLGTDSAMTGSAGMLAELAAARAALEDAGSPVDDAALFSMATAGAARALRLPDRGLLAEDAAADLLILRGRGVGDPHGSVVSAGPAEIYLVIKDGIPVYGDRALEPIFTELGVIFDRITVQGTPMLVAHGLRNLLEEARGALGGEVDFDFLPAALD